MDWEEREVISVLKRVLELDPHSSYENASRITSNLLEATFGKAFTNRANQLITESRSSFHQRSVLNPVFLQNTKNFEFHLFFIDSEPGWLDYVLTQIREQAPKLSSYVLYGIWDTLIVFFGTSDEAESLKKKLCRMAQNDVSHARIASCLRYHRHKPRACSAGPIEESLLSNAAGAYDLDDSPGLENRGVVLGPAWTSSNDLSLRVVAYVGINLRGAINQVEGDEILSALLRNELVSTTLVHLWETERGKPFDYIARFECKNMEELNEVTDVVSGQRIGRMTLDGSTFIVANGNEQALLIQESNVVELAEKPNFQHLEMVWRRTIGRQPPKSVNLFNVLDGSRQLVILNCLDELIIFRENAGLPTELDQAYSECVEFFSRAAIEGSGRMTGPVMHMAGFIEKQLRGSLQSLAKATFPDKTLMQNKLKLPGTDFSGFTIGDCINILDRISKMNEFLFVRSCIEPHKMKDWRQFHEYRNRWSHGRTPGDSLDIVRTSTDGGPDDAANHAEIDVLREIRDGRRAIILGAELGIWLVDLLFHMETTSTLELKGSKQTNKSFTYIAYSSKDEKIVENIAGLLKGFGLQAWFDKWEIGPGNSIVSKIEEGMAKRDTLVVVLSPSSVRSKWVKHELEVSLVDQLSGQDVMIIPILIEQCEIPQSLVGIRHIDFRDDFTKGMFKLVEVLKNRREGGGPAP